MDIAPNNFVKSGPSTSADGLDAPDSGLIVQFDGASWLDADGNNRDAYVPFSLPDFDVFEIDAETLAVSRQVRDRS